MKHMLVRALKLLSTALFMSPVFMHVGGGAGTGLPSFTFTGTYALINDGDNNWRVRFLTSGTLVFSQDVTIDLFLVGGGSGGSTGYANNSGGAGGYTRTFSNIVLQKNVSYSVVVGSGGAAGANGGKSWAFNESQYYSNGGYRSVNSCHGGSGGGGYISGAGGTNGSNGSGSDAGTGQGTTTYEFGDALLTLYSGGGGGDLAGVGGAGGGAKAGISALANTGGGGGGSRNNTNTPGVGGSGISVIRNHRSV